MHEGERERRMADRSLGPEILGAPDNVGFTPL